MSFSFGSGSGSAFGAQPSGGSSGFSFGASNTTNPTQTTGSSGFGFGSSASTPTSSSGFSFGSTPASAPASSGFSSFGSSSTAAPASGGFSFGSSSTPSTGFSFGSTSATTATSAPASSFSFGSGLGSSFGSTQASSSSPFSFGPSASTPTTSSFSFGSAPGASQPSSLFGASQTAGSVTPSAGGLFGTAQPSASFASNALAPTTESPLENLLAIKMAYQDPQQSRFKHMFYNIVEPTQVGLYARPGHISERLWKQAEADNPDPENCVPAAVIGFKQLNERAEAQQQFITRFKKYIEDLRSSLQVMENNCRAADVKLEKCRVDHLQLSHKLLEVMRKIEVYQCLRKPMHAEEIRLRNTLERLNGLLNQPNQYKARLQELVSLQRMQDDRFLSVDEKISEEDAETLRQVLESQREGLKQLTKIVQKDMRDMEIIKKGLHQRVRPSK